MMTEEGINTMGDLVGFAEDVLSRFPRERLVAIRLHYPSTAHWLYDNVDWLMEHPNLRGRIANSVSAEGLRTAIKYHLDNNLIQTGFSRDV